jgi:hypothetical protein
MTDSTLRKRPATLASGAALVLFVIVYAGAVALLLLPRDATLADPGASVNLTD